MRAEQLEYLKKDEIGKVLVQGLASVYTTRPEAPVAYLAQWLKSHSAKQRALQSHLSLLSARQAHLTTYTHTQEVKKAVEQARAHDAAQRQAQLAAFKNMVEAHDYHEQLLQEVFPEFLEQQLGLTGVYIGELNHPRQAVSEDDEGEFAHLDTKHPKIINYIGSSRSHRSLMVGKTLAIDKGVTGAAFGLDPPNYVYFPNVVKQEAVHYFRLPKLGAYIAIPLVYQSSLLQNVFDLLKKTKKERIAALHEFEEQRKADLQELEKERQEIAKKVAEGEEEAAEQLKEIEAKIKERREEQLEDSEAEAPFEKREFVVCGDTLGLDREMTEEERSQMVGLVEHFRSSWEAREKHLVSEDITFHIEYEKALVLEPLKEREALELRAEPTAEQTALFEAIEDDVLREYKPREAKLEALRKELQNNNHYKEAFLKLAHFRVIKFKDLIQDLLYVLRRSKAEINSLGKASLNWKKARETYITADTFLHLTEFKVEGPKTEVYTAYMKTPALLDKLDKYDEAEIFEYNIGLGALLKFIKSALELRQSNVEMRKVQKETQRKIRDQITEENLKITEEKRQALEKHKSSLLPEEVESFKEEEWTAKYDQEYPLKELGAQVLDDIDNDM